MRVEAHCKVVFLSCLYVNSRRAFKLLLLLLWSIEHLLRDSTPFVSDGMLEQGIECVNIECGKCLCLKLCFSGVGNGSCIMCHHKCTPPQVALLCFDVILSLHFQSAEWWIILTPQLFISPEKLIWYGEAFLLSTPGTIVRLWGFQFSRRRSRVGSRKIRMGVLNILGFVPWGARTWGCRFFLGENSSPCWEVYNYDGVVSASVQMEVVSPYIGAIVCTRVGPHNDWST